MKKKLIIGLILFIALFFTVWFILNRGSRPVQGFYNPQQTILLAIAEKINLKKLEPDMRLIWLSDENGKNLRPVLIRVGISDGQYTEIKEILFGEIKEGDFIVTGKATPGSQVSTPTQDINRILRSLR